MLAHCTRLGLDGGWPIYADLDGGSPTSRAIREAGVTVHVEAINLGGSIEQLQAHPCQRLPDVLLQERDVVRNPPRRYASGVEPGFSSSRAEILVRRCRANIRCRTSASRFISCLSDAISDGVKARGPSNVADFGSGSAFEPVTELLLPEPFDLVTETLV